MILSIILCVILILADYICKLVAVQALMPVGVLPAIPGLFEWRYVENTGAAFSFLAGKQTFLIIVTGLALLVVAYLLLFRRPKAKLEYLALILIFSGGVGNLIDRIARGYVVDYISLQFVNFAVFNLADIFVCVGFVILLISVIGAEVKAQKAKKAGNGQDAPDDSNDECPAEEMAVAAEKTEAKNKAIAVSEAELNNEAKTDEEAETNSFGRDHGNN